MFYDFLTAGEKIRFTNAKTLYHYCSCDAFKKIISSKEIWLSHYAFMNDFNEIKYFDYLLKLCIKPMGRKSDFEKEYLQKITHNSINAYFFCLSYEDDLLSNWVKYGDNGKGFVIGFNREYFDLLCNKILSFSSTSLRLRPVKYIENNEENFIKSIYDCCQESVKSEKNYFNKKSSVIPLLANELIQCRNFIKNKDFAEEQECRLALNVDNNPSSLSALKNLKELSFRTCSDALIPYYPLELSESNSIRTIVLGPKNHSREDDIRNFISRFYSFNIDIRKSNISYR